MYIKVVFPVGFKVKVTVSLDGTVTISLEPI